MRRWRTTTILVSEIVACGIFLALAYCVTLSRIPNRQAMALYLLAFCFGTASLFLAFIGMGRAIRHLSPGRNSEADKRHIRIAVLAICLGVLVIAAVIAVFVFFGINRR